ncbi:hypothetical protein P8452_14798 [Trifolium repens]|nr:hypothetical protein P8452_14798 [Trifolium repens]
MSVVNSLTLCGVLKLSFPCPLLSLNIRFEGYICFLFLKALNYCLTCWLTCDNDCWQSIVIGILAIVIGTFSTGIDSKCFQLRKCDKPAEEDGVPYGFWGLQQSRNGQGLALFVIGSACLPKVGASELGKGRALIGI